MIVNRIQQEKYFSSKIMQIFFFKNHAENEAGRLVLDLFLFFKKAFYEVKASGLYSQGIKYGDGWHASFKIIYF